MSPAPLALDFVRQRRWPNLLGWVLLVLGLSMATLEVRDFLARRVDLTEREQIVERLHHQLQRESRQIVQAPATPLRADEARPALRLAAQLGRDWPALFAALAASANEDVALLSVAPDGVRGVLNLTAQADNLQAMFDFLARLEADEGLHDVQLVSYEQASGRFVFNATSGWGTP